MPSITPPENLDDCFPSLHLLDDLQVFIDAYRENIKEMVKWFLKENLCDKCKKKILREKDAKI